MENPGYVTEHIVLFNQRSVLLTASHELFKDLGTSLNKLKLWVLDLRATAANKWVRIGGKRV